MQSSNAEDMNTTFFMLSLFVGILTYTIIYVRHEFYPPHSYMEEPEKDIPTDAILFAPHVLPLIVSFVTFVVFYFGWDFSFNTSTLDDNPTEILKEWKSK